MARPDNANGARAKVRTAAVIPVSTPLVRLYSEYMHAEYGDLDSDYVFVNLCGGRIGHAAVLPDGAQAHRPHQRPHRDRVHGAHAASHPRHRPDPPRRADRGRRPAAHAPVLDDDQPDLHPSRRHRRARSAHQGRRVGRRPGAHGEPTRPAAAARVARVPPDVVARRGRAQVDVEYASDHWHADRLGVPARRGRSTARFDTITQPWLREPGETVVPVPARHRMRVLDDQRRGSGLGPLLSVPRPSATRASTTRSPSPDRCSRTTCRGWSTQGYSAYHPRVVAQRDPGVLRRVPPPRLAPRAVRQRRHLRRGAPLSPRPGRPVHPRVRRWPSSRPTPLSTSCPPRRRATSSWC